MSVVSIGDGVSAKIETLRKKVIDSGLTESRFEHVLREARIEEKTSVSTLVPILTRMVDEIIKIGEEMAADAEAENRYML